MRVTVATVVVIGVVLLGAAAILFPAVQAAREAARQMECGSQLKQLCFAISNYHDTFQNLPYGARNRSTPPAYGTASWGPSWIVPTIHFMGANPGQDAIITADAAAPANDYLSTPVRQRGGDLSRQMKFFLLCPSSPLPETQTLGGVELLVPSYAGIIGATDEPDLDDPKTKGINRGFTDSRIVAGPYGGRVAGNGLLLLNESLTFEACTDGTANVILVGEVSDWYYTNAGEKRNPALSVGDAGDGPFEAAGWLAGSDLPFVDEPLYWRDGPVAQFVARDARPIPADRVCNLITVNFAVGTNNRRGANDTDPDWGTNGIGRCGLNIPLLSAHPAGAMVGYADGHVQLLTKQTAGWLLKKLAARDDGGVTVTGDDE